MGRGASLGRTSGGPPASGNKRENGVENKMKGKLIKTGAIALAIALFTACGSGDEPRDSRDAGTETSRTETRADTRTSAPMPTRPMRIDHLLTPTAKPGATKEEPTTAVVAAKREATEEPLSCVDDYRHLLVDYGPHFSHEDASSLSEELKKLRPDCAEAGWNPITPSAGRHNSPKYYCGTTVAGTEISRELTYKRLSTSSSRYARPTGRDGKGNILIHFEKLPLVDSPGCWYYKADDQTWSWSVSKGNMGIDQARVPTPTSPPPGSIASMIPEDPRTNDRVLLQDIYDQIDLEQFALDPDQQIAWRNIESDRRDHLQSLMPYPMVHQHPYLHLFPELEGMTREQQEDISYPPYDDISQHDKHRYQDLSLTRNGLIHFIYNPWFEPVFPRNFWGKRELRDSYHIIETSSYESSGAGPYWFGNNSVRGILAETVAELLDEAKLPSAEPAQEVWFGKDEKGKTALYVLEDRKWTMEEFISTTISHDERKVGEWCRPAGGSYLKHVAECGIIRNLHITPQVEWEILHPQLPIVKITAHARQTLPLAPAGMEKFSQDDFLKESKEAGQRYDMQTSYSVSFVMSLQNRWASFDDPNRWIIRFKDDLELYLSPPWKLDPELPYPNYWDDTDYMQHRIIGPVVLTIHEYWSDDAIPTLKPGTYSRVPRTAHWEAPGHIRTDEQMITIRRENLASGRTENPKGPALRIWPDLEALNAGFPLPGHVLTGPDQGPGTETWRKHGMEGHDW